MAVMSYDDVLSRARQLPFGAQVQLAEALLHNIRSSLFESPAAENQGLIPLTGLSEGELVALSEAVAVPEIQTELSALLDENRKASLSAEREGDLDSLLDEVDRIALLKARALYTLKLKRSVELANA